MEDSLRLRLVVSHKTPLEAAGRAFEVVEGHGARLLGEEFQGTPCRSHFRGSGQGNCLMIQVFPTVLACI